MFEKNLEITFLSCSLERERKIISSSEFNTLVNEVCTHCKARWLYQPRVILLAINPGSERSVACGTEAAIALKQLGSITAVTTSVADRVVEATVVVTLDPSSSIKQFPDTSEEPKRAGTLVLNPEAIDLIIGLGGDGTLLHIVWESFPHAVPPVVAFSLGSLGFMTMFDFQKFATIIQDIFFDSKSVTLHRRLKCVVENEVGRKRYVVMNEVSFERELGAGLSTLDVYCDKEHLTTVQGDGLILSSPCGSTAYSMSAGGPLVHPEVRGIIFTPLNPHSLSSRPVILPSHSVISVKVPVDARYCSWVSFDGRNRMELKRGDRVQVSVSRWPVPLYSPGKTTAVWNNQLKQCLGWNSRLIQGSKDRKR